MNEICAKSRYNQPIYNDEKENANNLSQRFTISCYISELNIREYGKFLFFYFLFYQIARLEPGSADLQAGDSTLSDNLNPFVINYYYYSFVRKMLT